MARVLFFVLPLLALGASAPEPLRWEAEFAHYTPAESPDFWAWRIFPPGLSGSKSVAPAADFETTLDTIFTRDQNPRITTITIRSSMDNLQEQVIKYLIQHGSIAPATATTSMRWKVHNGARDRIQAMKDAILKSEFVASLDGALRKRGKRVTSLQLEEVAVELEKKPPIWQAGMWLDVDKPCWCRLDASGTR